MKPLLLLFVLSLPLSARIGEKYSDFAKRLEQPEKPKSHGGAIMEEVTHSINSGTVRLLIHNRYKHGVEQRRVLSEWYSSVTVQRAEAILAFQNVDFKKDAESSEFIDYRGKEGTMAIYYKEKKVLYVSVYPFVMAD